MDEQTRVALFYTSLSLSGEWDVDWTTGALSKRKVSQT